MMSSPTLLPWVRAHKFALLSLASTGVTVYGFYTIPINDSWWQYVGVGTVGLIAFGVLTAVAETSKEKHHVSRVVGITAASIGLTVVAGALLSLLLLFALLVFILDNLHGMH